MIFGSGKQAGLYVYGLDGADTDGETISAGRARRNFKLVDWRAVKAALAKR